MNNGDGLVLPVVVATLLLLFMCGFVVLLLVMNNTRRIRHRAQLAEMRQQLDRAVMDAGRESMYHTLQEIGRELHDNVGQLLSVAQLGLNTTIDSGMVGPALTTARDALEQGTEEVRRMGRDLNVDLWHQRSLVEAIGLEAQRVERVSRIQVDLTVSDTPPVLDPDTSTVLFRVFQVILVNALKHSGATRIGIGISTAKGIGITITDNGRGFDPDQVKAHAGMMNIHQRCALIRWKAECTTSPGNGCTWHLRPTI